MGIGDFGYPKLPDDRNKTGSSDFFVAGEQWSIDDFGFGDNEAIKYVFQLC